MSPTLKAQLGYGDAEISNDKASWLELVHADDRAAVRDAIDEYAIGRVRGISDNEPSKLTDEHISIEVLRGAAEHTAVPTVIKQTNERLADASALNSIEAKAPLLFEAEFRMRHKNGQYRWILARGSNESDDSDRAPRLVGAQTDITDRKREQSRFKSAVEASPTAMVMVNDLGTIVLANSQAYEMFGYDYGALQDVPLGTLVPERAKTYHEGLWQAFMNQSNDRQMGNGRIIHARHITGREFRVEIGLTTIEDEDGKFVLASISDITQQIEAQQRIERLLHYDVLTGLANRTLFKEQVEQKIREILAHDQTAAVVFFDIDNFKYINDTLGHEIGDKLLIQVSRRLRNLLGPENLAARISGDEFVFMLADGEEETVVREVTRIKKSISKVYKIDGQELTLSASIGIAICPTDGRDYETLMQCADTAMHRAKEEGRNTFRFFAKEMQQRTYRLLKLESAMHSALAENQFRVVYQPQFDLDGQRLIGVEALLRWTHPELGSISPAEFIPLAERNGHIVAIGTWVLSTAAKQLKNWMDAGLYPIKMAVNLSAVQFRQADLPELVAEILENSGLPAQQLELELTESVAMDNPHEAIATMERLNRLGVLLSIDDFGTGYSSLSYLKRFSVYKLKIDQSFVRDIVTDPDDRAIVLTIISLAHHLGFLTIAEGVETAEQYAFLKDNGCDEFQGYYFGRPMPPEEISYVMQAKSLKNSSHNDTPQTPSEG